MIFTELFLLDYINRMNIYGELCQYNNQIAATKSLLANFRQRDPFADIVL